MSITTYNDNLMMCSIEENETEHLINVPRKMITKILDSGGSAFLKYQAETKIFNNLFKEDAEDLEEVKQLISSLFAKNSPDTTKMKDNVCLNGLSRHARLLAKENEGVHLI